MEKITIIGAGLTGLSAGITLQQHGIQSEIYEMAPWPGGVCTAWTRKGFTFDGCIHWMVGTKKGEPMRNLYESVHALKPETKIFNMDSIFFEKKDAHYEIPLEVNQFKTFLLTIAPEDRNQINRFCKEIERITKTEMIPGKPKNLEGYFHSITKGRFFLRAVIKYINITVEQYSKRFKNNELKQVIYHLMHPSFSMFALVMMLGTRMAKNGGYPMGGARDMIKNMSDYYLSLGGQIHYNSQIEEIIIHNNKAVGVKSKDKQVNASHIIAACDMYDTLNHMLKGQYQHEVLNKLLQEAPLFEPLIIVSLGLKTKFNIPHSAVQYSNIAINTSNHTTTNQYHIRTFDFEPSFAPKDQSSIMITMSAPFQYWHQLRTDNIEIYRKVKNQVAHEVIELLDLRYKGIKNAIEVIDVATPATYKRINNLYQGSFEGFLPVPKTFKTKINPKIPNIKNLYLAGQWVTPGGGIPPAIMSGIETAQKIIKEQK